VLYELHELHKTMSAPLVAWADVSQRLLTNPYSPFAYHPLSRHFAAGNELAARLMTLGLYSAAYAEPFEAWQGPADRFDLRPRTVEEYIRTSVSPQR